MIKIYSVQEVAKILDVSERQVQRMITAGKELPRLELLTNNRRRLGVEGHVLHAYMKSKGISNRA